MHGAHSMEFYQLRTFLVISEVGSLTKAVDKLWLTQPAISRQVQALEASLGVVLFERTRRSMRLTDAGVVLQKYAERCMSLIVDCEQALEEVRVGTVGHIHLGVGGTHPMYELPELLQSFASRFPDVEVSVRTGRSQEIIDSVHERQLDLAFIRTPIADPGIHSVYLYEEPIILVAQPGQCKVDSSLELEDVLSYPIILFPKGTSFRKQVDTMFSKIQITPRIRLETDSVEEIRRFVALGMGIAFLPASTVEDDLIAKRLVQLHIKDMPEVKRQTSLIYLRDRYQSAATREFIKEVVK